MTFSIFTLVVCTIMIAIVLIDLIKRKEVVRNSLRICMLAVCVVYSILELASVQMNTALSITLASLATVTFMLLLVLFVMDLVKSVKAFKKEMSQIPADIADEYRTDNTTTTDNNQANESVVDNDSHQQSIEQSSTSKK